MFLSLKTLYRKRTVIWPFYFYTIIRTLSKDERKIYIYLNDDDISKFNALFEDVEQFLNI
ncbi:hypothetical protein THI2018120TP_06170 [Staphylococcus aureus]|nr:hypothetical protein THI2018120TP_06170 [Staphylococcus aureus]